MQRVDQPAASRRRCAAAATSACPATWPPNTRWRFSSGERPRKMLTSIGSRSSRVTRSSRAAPRHLPRSRERPSHVAPCVATGATWREHAVAAKGFMPPDEGDALHAAALAAAAAVPGAPFVEVGSYCGRSTIWLGRGGPRGRHGRVRRRPPPWVGGEPGRLGVPRPDRRRRADRADGHAAVLPPRCCTTPGWRTYVVAVVGQSPIGRRATGDAVPRSSSSMAATASSRRAPTTRAGPRVVAVGGTLEQYVLVPK